MLIINNNTNVVTLKSHLKIIKTWNRSCAISTLSNLLICSMNHLGVLLMKTGNLYIYFYTGSFICMYIYIYISIKGCFHYFKTFFNTIHTQILVGFDPWPWGGLQWLESSAIFQPPETFLSWEKLNDLIQTDLDLSRPKIYHFNIVGSLRMQENIRRTVLNSLLRWNITFRTIVIVGGK